MTNQAMMKNSMFKRQILLMVVASIVLLILIYLPSCKESDEIISQIKDADGNVYTTVTIGTQEWMVENLRTTKYRNGDPIQNILPDDVSWETLTTGAYSNDNSGNNKNGRLYNWYAVNDSRKLAPEGWHVPTLEEWNVLINFLGGELLAASKLKEKGGVNWCAPNSDSTNESGFTALPGDWRIDIGIITGCGDSPFWMATEKSISEAYNLFLFEGSSEVSIVFNNKFVGWGVRCIKD